MRTIHLPLLGLVWLLAASAQARVVEEEFDLPVQVQDAYGKAIALPTLWIYTENDQYVGAGYPKEWFQAFREAGGQGEFVQFPAAGEDGHLLFTAFPAIWQPVIAGFLRRQGYAVDEEAHE